MLKLKTLYYPHPVLKKKASTVTANIFENGVEELGVSLPFFVQALYEHCSKEGGVGLAAPQVGISLRIFVTDYKDSKKVFINPKLTPISGKLVSTEGCLSCPGYQKRIMRHDTFKLEYKDLDAVDRECIIQSSINFLGKIIQHEYDHLEGICIEDLKGL
jgi:peptide deformylase